MSLADDLYRIELPRYNKGAYEIWSFVYDSPRSIGGEDTANQHYNVVSNARQLGKWDGVRQAVTFKMPQNTHSKGVAVIIQDTKTRAIHYAAKIE